MRLATRVALAYALGTAGVLATMGWAVDRVLATQLEQRDTDELLGKLDQARHLVAEQPTAAALAQTRHVLADLILGHEGTSLRIVDATSGEVLVSAGAAAEAPLPTGSVAVAPERAALASDIVSALDAGAQPWRLLVADALAADASRVQVQLARTEADSMRLAARFRGALAPLVVLAALVTAIYGWVVVARGVAPLRRIAQAAERLGTRHLDERLAADTGAAEVRELAAAFNEMAVRLQEGVQRLSRFGDDLAHEFRTPLATLVAHTEVVLRQARSEAELRALLEANLEDYARLARMVDEMLFLARADNARAGMRYEPVAIEALAQRMVEFYEPLAHERDIKIEAVGNARVAGDAALIERALANLLSNAIRHARVGTVVQISIGAPSTAGGAVLAVRNEGAGIAAADVPHVFERFWRGDAARSSDSAERSTGLGLAIVQAIARLHEAQVQVASQPGGWTEFRILFPAAGALSSECARSSRDCA